RPRGGGPRGGGAAARRWPPGSRGGSGRRARHARERKNMAEMDIQKILALLPQRYPLLLIDRVRECEPGKRVVALKNVSANEPYFVGHFPGRPIMPGVLILEAMEQADGILRFSAMGAQ